MKRFFKLVNVIFSSITIIFGLLGVTLFQIIKAAGGGIQDQLTVVIFAVGLGIILITAIVAVSLLRESANVDDKFMTINKELSKINKEFVDREMPIFDQVFDSETELYKPDEEYNGAVYRTLKHYIKDATESLKILTVPGVGDAAVANECIPMSKCDARDAYFYEVEKLIAQIVKRNIEFRYYRVHQVVENVADIENKSLLHCTRVFNSIKKYPSSLFKPSYIANQRNTGFIIIDDKVLILLISGVTKVGKPNEKVKFVPYIMSIQIFSLRGSVKPPKLQKLISHHIDAFKEILIQSTPISADDPYLPIYTPFG
jgi:hypothetical protein